MNIDANLLLCEYPAVDFVLNTTALSKNTPIALVAERGSCTFEQKARVAMQISKQCGRCVDTVIIYDSDPSSTVLPAWNAQNSSNVDVMVLGIMNDAGRGLVKTMDKQKATGEYYSNNGAWIRFDWEGFVAYETYLQWLMTMVGSAILVVGSVLSVCFCLKTGYIRREGGSLVIGRNSNREILMNDEEVRALPDIVFKASHPEGEGEGDAEEGGILSNASQADSQEDFNGDDRTSYFENNCCSVCLEEYEGGETLKLLPCKHAFHEECVLPWLTKQHSNCPLCKSDVLTASEKEAKRGHERISSDILPPGAIPNEAAMDDEEDGGNSSDGGDDEAPAVDGDSVEVGGVSDDLNAPLLDDRNGDLV
jgi:hypothetical protein